MALVRGDSHGGGVVAGFVFSSLYSVQLDICSGYGGKMSPIHSLGENLTHLSCRWIWVFLPRDQK
jgi:hypothetical protein